MKRKALPWKRQGFLHKFRNKEQDMISFKVRMDNLAECPYNYL